MRHAILTTLLVGLAAISAARADTLRYALVVGNNHGVHPTLGPQRPLRHAERDAHALAESLRRLGRFEDERVAVVTGADRDAILRAAAQLAARRRRDRLRLGAGPALFMFFFTGHGAERALLTPGAPLAVDDITAIFERVDAELAVAVVDACHAGSLAGSLAESVLQGKGAAPTGFNPITVPDAPLTARGLVWLMSSRPEETSYEHRRLGGLFTHYFIDALTAAPADRLGVSLDAIWEHARRRTTLHARRLDRAQTPQKIVRRLTAQGPIYLSFPRARTARLVLGEAVDGELFLSYLDDASTERVVKHRGAPLELAIHPGPLVVSMADAHGTRRPVWAVDVTQNAHLHLDATGVTRALAPHPDAVDKGARVDPEARWWLDVGGRASPWVELAASRWGVELAAHRETGRASLGAAIGWSHRGRDTFETWASTLSGASVRLEAGPATTTHGVRLGLLGHLDGELGWQEFGDGVTKTRTVWAVGALGRLWLPVWHGALTLDLGLRVGRADSLSASETPRWFTGPTARVGVAFPLDGG